MEVTHRSEADDGELPVRQYGGTFADIQLSPGSYLTVRTPADADRLIKAAAAAKSLLLGDVIPPLSAQDLGAAETSPANTYGSTLASLRDRKHYQVPDDAEPGNDPWARVCAESYGLRNGGRVRCTLAPGHAGNHHAGGTDKDWPQEPVERGEVVDLGDFTQYAVEGPWCGRMYSDTTRIAPPTHRLVAIEVPADGAA